MEDRVLDVASFDKFLHDHIKVGGKAGALGDSVVITREKTKILITADLPFAKRCTYFIIFNFSLSFGRRQVLEIPYEEVPQKAATS